jgi:hypothetical protein
VFASNFHCRLISRQEFTRCARLSFRRNGQARGRSPAGGATEPASRRRGKSNQGLRGTIRRSELRRNFWVGVGCAFLFSLRNTRRNASVVRIWTLGSGIGH